MKKSEIIFGLARIPIDFLMIAFAFVTAYTIRLDYNLIPKYSKAIDLATFPHLNEYILLVTQFGIGLIILLILHGSYSFKVYNTFSNEFKSVLRAWSTWIGLMLLFYFIIRDFPFSRLVIIYGWVLAFFFLFIGRLTIKTLQKSFLHFGIGVRKIAFIGYNDSTEKIINSFQRNKQYSIIGVISDKYLSAQTLEKIYTNYLGKEKDLKNIIQKNLIEEIISTDSQESDMEIINTCRETHTRYHFVPDQVQLHKTKIEMHLVEGYPLITFKTTPIDGWGRVVKRIVDIFFSLVAIIVLTPFSVIIAILIKMDSKGPILFTKLDDGKPVQRVGEKGKPFKFYKFRSMHDKSHNLRYTELANKNKRKGPMVKITDDPRITKLGKILRKYDIDEWPQFVNVLIGNMSLVGPRPHLPEEVSMYNSNHKFVLSIKPGITGLAQVNGRSSLDFEQEVALDKFYIENWSLWLDIKICFKTIFVIIKGKGE